jgi:hypothetical protein
MSVVFPEVYAVAAVGGRWVMVAVDEHALPRGQTFERREAFRVKQLKRSRSSTLHSAHRPHSDD